jgi:hypothetical protein
MFLQVFITGYISISRLWLLDITQLSIDAGVQIPTTAKSLVLMQGIDRSRVCASRGKKYAYGQIYMYMSGSSVNIQIPTHCNLIVCSTIATPPLLSPSSILPPLSSHCDFVHAKEMHSYRVSKLLFISFWTFLKHCVNLKLIISKRVCTLSIPSCCVWSQ